jgi:hypothetical protein
MVRPVGAAGVESKRQQVNPRNSGRAAGLTKAAMDSIVVCKVLYVN